MIRMFFCLVALAVVASQAEAAVETRPILSGTEYVHARSTKSIPLYLGGPVRIISIKVQAASTTRQSVNTDISVAGVSVGTIMLPGRNPDPTFSAGGSGVESTSSIEFTSYGGTVAISQIYVTFEVVPPVVVRVEPTRLPWDTFVFQSPVYRTLDQSNAPSYFADATIMVVDRMLFHVSPAEWEENLFPIKWKAALLLNLARPLGASNRDVINAIDSVIAAIDGNVDYLAKMSLAEVSWKHVLDLLSLREKLAALSGNTTRLSLPAKLNPK